MPAAAEVVEVSQAPEDPLILSVAQSSAGFAAELFGRLKTQAGNLSFAPLSLSQALVPVAVGARGPAGEELLRALHLTVPVADAADGLNDLLRRIQRSAGGESGLGFAKALWVQQWNSINPEYIDSLRRHCPGELRVVDFSRGDHAAHWMNRWVSDCTDDRISAIADAAGFDADTRLVVGAAVYLKTEWKEGFDPALTELAPFYLPASAPAPAAAEPVAAAPSPAPAAAPTPVPIEVPTMRRIAPLRVAVLPGFRLLQLPYRGARLSMVVLLPEAEMPLARIEDQLTGEHISECLRSVRQAQPTRVELRLPRFKAERPVPQLGSALQEMGVKTVFDHAGAADLSALASNSEGAPLYLSVVKHLVKLSVDEQGAAAAAGSSTAPAAPYDAPVEAPTAFHVDRPFLFFICDTQTGGLLFMGRVVDPRAG